MDTKVRTQDKRTVDRIAYSIDEVAQACGIGVSKLYYEIRDGRLVVSKVGGRTLVTRDNLAAWLTAAEVRRGAA